MRHLRSRLRLKQKPGHSRMLQRNLVTSILLYESVRTTRKRAKVVQPIIDRLITYAKNNPPQVAIRYVNRVVTDKNASKKIMEVYCHRYKDRPSGLSRIVPAGVRKGDGAEVVDLSMLDGAPVPAVAKDSHAEGTKGKQGTKGTKVTKAKKETNVSAQKDSTAKSNPEKKATAKKDSDSTTPSTT